MANLPENATCTCGSSTLDFLEEQYPAERFDHVDIYECSICGTECRVGKLQSGGIELGPNLIQS